MKISLCITVFNEEKQIRKLLESIAAQTQQPDEVIIVDGGSTDATASVISNKPIKLIRKEGNRAVGRNEAIRQASSDIIALTDAGCELDKHWLEEITKPFKNTEVQVVAGYYAGKPKNILQKSLVPYVLVMPDRINHAHFLPAARSMAMRKYTWEKLGGFPQEYTWNEDYVFSKRLEKAGIPIAFAQKAIAYWFPRETVWEGWRMFYNFARGDAQAGIWRPKVALLLLRIAVAVALAVSGLWFFLGILGVFYLLWGVLKNYRYAQHPLALVYLPLWQLVSDSAVCIGTLVGFFERYL